MKNYCNNTNDQKQLLIALRQGNAVSERSESFWGDDEKRQVIQMYDAGIGISEMAMNLQRSENAVVQRLLTQGLLTPPNKKRNHRRNKPKCRCPQCRLLACPYYNQKEGTCSV